MAYIEKEPLCAWLSNMGVSEGIIKAIENNDRFPTADVVEVKHGAWEKQQFVGRSGFFSIKDFFCKECGESFEVGQGKGLMNFCPNCGAKMDERSDT